MAVRAAPGPAHNSTSTAPARTTPLSAPSLTVAGGRPSRNLIGGRRAKAAEQLTQAQSPADVIEFAREVGLISVYEGTDTEPVRFAVPEIYRLALNMRRKGQA